MALTNSKSLHVIKKDPPLYTRAKMAIQEMIQSGKYPPGTNLPPETELTNILGVSRVILREALRVLEEDSVLIRRHGLPTVVNYPFPVLVSDLNKNFSFTEVIRNNGYDPGVSYLDLKRQKAGKDVASRLKINPGTTVCLVQRVRTANGRPLAYTVDIYQDDLIQVEMEDYREGASIYTLLELKGTPVHHGLARILPVKAGADVAEKLGINPETVILVIKQVDYDKEDRPLLYTEEYHLRQAFQFTVYRER